MRFKIANMRFEWSNKLKTWGISVKPYYVKMQLGSLRVFLSKVPLEMSGKRTKLYERRIRLLRRDGHKCAFCGRKLSLVTLSVHHIKPQALYPELAEDLNNMMCLCAGCHQKFHKLADRGRTKEENTVRAAAMEAASRRKDAAKEARAREEYDRRTRATQAIPVISVNPVEKTTYDLNYGTAGLLGCR